MDVWAENLCRGITAAGHTCTLDLRSVFYQFLPCSSERWRAEGAEDIVHSNAWHGHAFKGAAPLVVTEHHVVHDPAYDPYRTTAQRAYHRWVYWCQQRTLGLAAAVTCDSHYTQRMLEQVFGYRRSRVVHIGIDATRFRPV